MCWWRFTYEGYLTTDLVLTFTVICAFICINYLLTKCFILLGHFYAIIASFSVTWLQVHFDLTLVMLIQQPYLVAVLSLAVFICFSQWTSRCLYLCPAAKYNICFMETHLEREIVVPECCAEDKLGTGVDVVEKGLREVAEPVKGFKSCLRSKNEHSKADLN